MTTTDQYDALVIGAGQAGVPLATELAKAGWKTTLVERAHVGGTCINDGCAPTKTMVASARVAHLARRASDYGVRTGPISVDMATVRQRKRDIVESFRGGSQRRIESTDSLALLMGQAQFTGPKTVEVHLNQGGTRLLEAAKIFVNVGARPRIPELPGLDKVDYLTSTTIMELDQVPDHLLIIGGGYIGLEFGQMFRRFGSQVTIVQRRDQLLTQEDRDVADEVAGILREDGIGILLETWPQRVERGPEGKLRLLVRTSEEERTLVGSHLLVAAGRAPNTDRLNLETAGVELDARGFILADEQLRTNVPGIYALGDVNGGPAFTHISYDDYRLIRDSLLQGRQSTTEGRLLPYVVFIDPQLGRVGLTEKAAAHLGRAIRVAKMPMNWVARAPEVDETRGLMKVVVDAETDQILGAAILGILGGEVVTVLQMAMMGGLPYMALRDAVFAHPTLAEALNNLFMDLEG